MAKRILLGIAILLAASISLIFILFVTLIFFGTSTFTSVTLANGRVVNASVRSIYLGVETNNNTAIVRTIRSKVVVEPTKFTVDDQFSGPIPASARTVDVEIDGSQVNITADGVPVTP